MFESMGTDTTDRTWERSGKAQVAERLGGDLAVFVVDHPEEAGRLVACAAGTVAKRLPTPLNPPGIAGYVQWVCTDPDFRRQGLGRSVMEALLEWYDERTVPTVELHATPVAEALYVSLGFGESGPRALRRRR
jgi:GNAT superfamily N-acetyltransferase